MPLDDDSPLLSHVERRLMFSGENTTTDADGRRQVFITTAAAALDLSNNNVQARMSVVDDKRKTVGKQKCDDSTSSQVNYCESEETMPTTSSSTMSNGDNEKQHNIQQGHINGKSISSMISFSSSMEGESGEHARPYELLGHKVEMVYSLLSMLGSHDRVESSQTFLSMSQELESSQLMRHHGCLTLLIQLLHNGDVTATTPNAEDLEVMNHASQALRNLVRFQVDEQRQKRESRILRPLEQIRAYVLRLRLGCGGGSNSLRRQPPDPEVGPAMAVLMKLSFDEEHRHATFTLGGLQAIAETLIMDQFVFGANSAQTSLTLRRYIGMTLTNLTFGAAQSKQILCSYPKFLEALNCQIDAPFEDLRSVFASVLRNLSWKADKASKIALRNAATVVVLMKAAMQVDKESTLKSVLSALWNLSSHCSENKQEICAVPGALEFLVATLTYDGENTSIVENGGGILRNISSHIAIHEEYREILRRNNCFPILLRHLQSPSLTIVSNSCGTLWNLSAHNAHDQRALWELDAVPMLRNLVHSKHKMISMGSSATLKNLLASKPAALAVDNFGGVAASSLMKARNKYRVLECEIDDSLTDVYGGGVCSSSNQFFGSNSSNFGSVTGQNLSNSMEMRRQAVAAPFNSLNQQKQQHPTFGYANFASTSSPCVVDVMKSSSISNCSTSSTTQRSKVEQLQADRSITQRFHNSLRRSQQREQQKFVDDDGEEIVRSYCVEANIPSAPLSSVAKYQQQQQQQHSSYINDESASPENVKSYAVEGTPAHLSHSSSLSDLRILMDAKDAIKEKSALSEKPSSASTSQRESKPTTAMQTPMMYSRHSSLQSLDSCDQQSVRSTVYSEHSQLPTGLHSPSELPDSPTQTPNFNCQPKNTLPMHPNVFHPSVVPLVNLKPMVLNSQDVTVLNSSNLPILNNTSGVSPSRANSYFDGSLTSDLPKVYRVETLHSTTSSLSGLTLDDDDCVVKPSRPLTFGVDEEPKMFTHHSKNYNSPADTSPHFKVPVGAPPKKCNAAKNEQQKCNVGGQFSNGSGPMLGVREDPVGVEAADYRSLIESALPKPKVRSSPKLKSANLVQQNSIDLANYVSSQHRGKNVAIAKPMVREVINASTSADKLSSSDFGNSSLDSNPSFFKAEFASQPLPTGDDEEQDDLRVYATEPTPGASLRSSFNNLYIKSAFKDEKNCQTGKPHHGSPCLSSSKQTTAAPSPKTAHSFDYNEEAQPNNNAQYLPLTPPVTDSSKGQSEASRERTDVEECIYSALPKPKNRKSKSLDRRSQHRQIVASCLSESPTKRSSKGSSNIDLDDGKGILEMSQISLVDSIDLTDIGGSTQEDCLKLSTYSNLVQTSSTCEKVKDATTLMNRATPTKRQPTSPSSPLHVISSMENSTSACLVVKSSSDETNESLSEDNYSRIEDEQFDVTIEDIDIDLLASSALDESPQQAGATGVHFTEDFDDTSTLDALLSAHEFLIDCETLSLASDGFQRPAASSAVGGKTTTPNILTKEQSASEASLETKKIKGGKKLISKHSESALNATFAAPKLAVRTTKTVELRAKRASETSERLRTASGGSRSASPGTPRKWANSPRTSDAELDMVGGRFSRNTFERRSRQSTSSGDGASDPPPPGNNVASWPRALSNYNFDKSSSSLSGKTLVPPFLKIDLVPNSNSSPKTKPAVPPKPSKFRRSPQEEKNSTHLTSSLGKKSVGKHVGSKIASLWRKGDVYNAEASAESQASDDGLLNFHAPKKSPNLTRKEEEFNGPTSCIVQPFSYTPKSPQLSKTSVSKSGLKSPSLANHTRNNYSNPEPRKGSIGLQEKSPKKNTSERDAHAKDSSSMDVDSRKTSSSAAKNLFVVTAV